MPADGTKEIRPERVAIYIRWSTEEQSEGTTLAEQRDGCEHYLRSQGWCVSPALIFVDDGYSGGTLERPGMQRLRDLVQKGEVDCVVLFKIDRLSRNIVDATHLVLVEWKDRCHLRCVRQPIDTTSETGRMIFSILATFADFERGQITERTYSGRLRRIREGKAYGGCYVPFGLMATGEPGVRALDPERAPIVAEMFRQVQEEGASPHSLAIWLRGQGVAPPGLGKSWRYNTIRHILSNPIYAGRLVYGRDARVPLVDVRAVTVPAIVSQETFEAVQAVIRQRSRFHRLHRRASDGANLLSGVATCRCGGPVCIHFSRGQRYYWCSRRASHGPVGCAAEAGILLADQVERSVVAELLRRFADRSRQREAARLVLAQMQNQARSLKREQVRLQGERDRLDGRLAELRTRAGLGEISVAEWRELRTALEQRRTRLVAELTGATAAATHAELLSSTEEQLVQRTAGLDRWHELSPVEQKSILCDLVESVELFKPRGWNQPYEISITWRYGLVTEPTFATKEI